jgi:superfamily II DNA or RNA helicase
MSFLEYAFLRWVLTPAVRADIAPCVQAQAVVSVANYAYRVDYEFVGAQHRICVELDGFAFHGDRQSFSYDRLRQNDLQATGCVVARFSYDSIRTETARCVQQLQAILARDPLLARFLIAEPIIEQPQMDPDPLQALRPSPYRGGRTVSCYFDEVRDQINHRTLRECQTQAFAALANYYRGGGQHAACVMSVGAGKTALGVLACFAFTHRRAMVVTPGSVIRGTFEKAFDHEAVGNVLYGLPGGPLIPGCRPPQVRVLDREDGSISAVTRDELLAADVIVTNFHALGSGDDPDDLLAKLAPDDIDLIIVDEAHIAASESYQRTFRHFGHARTLLMSACFQRLDGKPIDADVVYRYRLIDSIADGNAKNLRVQRFHPDSDQSTYEMVWPDGRREEIHGRDAMLELLADERKLARVTAKSHEPIRQVMRATAAALREQAELLYPVKPRVLFSALGERHAEQIAQIAEEHGIPCAHLHHTMPESRINAVRARYEQDSGDLQGIVQLKMLGQGYDFPPITIVVPMRPYGSFSEFYQFIGRGIRVLQHPALIGRVGPGEQFLDIIYHAELGLDAHVETIYRENDMDPATIGLLPSPVPHGSPSTDLPGSTGRETALAQRYATYAQSTSNPVTFEQFADVMRKFGG